MSNDFWLGATYTLAVLFAGVLVTLIFTAVLADREPPDWGPQHETPPIDPTPEDLVWRDVEADWLAGNTITEFPEVNLKP